MILNERESRHEHVLHVARQMMTAARTAPKGKGVDIIEIAMVTDGDINILSEMMVKMVAEHGMKFFLRDAENILNAECVLLIGTHEQAQGLNCGHCGYATCVSRKEGVPCALNSVDVGIAIGAGTDVAIESADVVLMKSSLLDIPAAMDLSRAVLRNIKQNLFWAFFYNSIGIPVAAGVLYPALHLTLNPMLAAAAMSLSSVCVVSNALRLRGWKPPVFPDQPVPTAPLPESAVFQSQGKEENTVNKTIHIDGMMCTHCTGRVEKALNDLPGVEATVDLDSKSAAVTCTPDVSDDTLRQAVEDAGYHVTGIR